MSGEASIPDALRHLDRLLRPAVDAAHAEIADGLAEAYRDQVTEVGAVRTGRFRDTIAVREATRAGEVREHIVMSEVSYSDIIERGRNDTDKYPGRFPAERAIMKHAGRLVGEAFDHQLSRTFGAMS